MTDFDVAIVGGGLAGTALAVAASRSKLNIALIEPRPAVGVPELDARIYAISSANQRFLDSVGVWGRLDLSRISPVHTMRIFGDNDGQLRFDAETAGINELAWIAESSVIHHELWETLRRQHNVSLLTSTGLSGFKIYQDQVALQLQNGRSLCSRLIVGADGVQSKVRELAHIDAEFTPYQQQGIVANFQAELPHRNVAYQWFNEFGVLALLPLPANRLSMVWSVREEFAQHLLKQENEALAALVQRYSDSVTGVLSVITPAQGFPLRMMRVARTVQPRLALIGDAAHAIHPLSGHGINLGFQDAKSLAAVLNDKSSWEDPGDISLLRRYARNRAEEPFVMQKVTHGLNALFGQDDPLMAFVRNSGLNFIDKIPVLRRLMVNFATAEQ